MTARIRRSGIGLLRSYLRQFNPNYTRDQQRKAFQKQQWRKRVDAQMRGARQPSARDPSVPGSRTTFFRFVCLNCNAQLESPASRSVTCPLCGFEMWVKAGARSHSVGPANSTATPRPSTTSELERLAKLHSSGALTDAEFAAAKTRVLSQP